MLKITQLKLDELESRHEGITRQIDDFERNQLPSCPKCKAIDTAKVQVGVIGRTICIAMATTTIKLAPNNRLGKYFCNVCEEYFD